MARKPFRFLDIELSNRQFVALAEARDAAYDKGVTFTDDMALKALQKAGCPLIRTVEQAIPIVEKLLPATSESDELMSFFLSLIDYTSTDKAVKKIQTRIRSS